MSPFYKLLDVFLPPRCGCCQEIVADPQSLCFSCWDKMNFISHPACRICGLPFEIDVADGAICLTCVKKRPIFHQARFVMAYDEFSKGLILSFKHGDRTDLLPLLGRWMTNVGETMISKDSLIVPVPLHWRRLLYRKYNQAGLLAGFIAKEKGCDWAPQGLRRLRHTKSQGTLSRMAREKNVRHVFKAQSIVEGRDVVLIDDVMTTGATIFYATKALLDAGAKQVNVITLARVI